MRPLWMGLCLALPLASLAAPPNVQAPGARPPAPEVSPLAESVTTLSNGLPPVVRGLQDLLNYGQGGGSIGPAQLREAQELYRGLSKMSAAAGEATEHLMKMPEQQVAYELLKSISADLDTSKALLRASTANLASLEQAIKRGTFTKVAAKAASAQKTVNQLGSVAQF